MNSDFKKDLDNARQLKNSGNYKEALEIYNKHYPLHSNEFKYNQKANYAWAIIKSDEFQDNVIDSAEFITDMIPQKDLKVNKSCPYTTAVFKVLIHFKNNGDYVSMIPWLKKLNPLLLDDKTYISYGKVQKSRKEKYYDWLSKAYLDDYNFDECIEVSKKALDELKTFHYEGDVWHKRRIAKAYKELNNPNEALKYYLDVVKVKPEWYINRDIAEIYCNCGKYSEALNYLCPIVLSQESDNAKVNAYYLIYKALTKLKSEHALIHAQIYYLIQSKNGYDVPYDIEKLDIDYDELDLKNLRRKINDLWIQYKYKNCKKYCGVVIKFFSDENFGFIECDDGMELFFHNDDVAFGNIFIGENVTFCIDEYFSKHLNEKSVKAVNIRVK